jgi:hypothetical protein
VSDVTASFIRTASLSIRGSRHQRILSGMPQEWARVRARIQQASALPYPWATIHPVLVAFYGRNLCDADFHLRYPIYSAYGSGFKSEKMLDPVKWRAAGIIETGRSGARGRSSWAARCQTIGS